MGEGLAFLLMAVAIFLMIILLIIPLVLVIVYAVSMTTDRKKLYNKLKSNNQELLSQGDWYPVRYSSEKKFHSWFKIFPWETAGILYIGNDKIIFLSEIFSYKQIEIELNPEDARVKWLGRRFINGATSWLELATSVQKHYFSSETGALVFGSKSTTKEIYQRLKETLKK